MFYCPKCSRLTEDPLCPHCHSATRKPRENDPVLLSGLGMNHAAMLEPLLVEAGIPFSRMGTVGAAFAMTGGLPMEEIRFCVPWGAYDAALALAETVLGKDA